jgi:hypothetical protein
MWQACQSCTSNCGWKDAFSRGAFATEVVSFVVADVERFSRIDIDPWFETGSRRPTPLEIITRRGVGM